jgi:hypothetical protein
VLKIVILKGFSPPQLAVPLQGARLAWASAGACRSEKEGLVKITGTWSRHLRLYAASLSLPPRPKVRGPGDRARSLESDTPDPASDSAGRGGGGGRS